MAMAADVIVAQSLTITGSIGVVLGKFNLQELYRRVGYTKTPISRGRCGPRSSNWVCGIRVAPSKRNPSEEQRALPG